MIDISVIVVVHNEESSIGQCIKSICHQFDDSNLTWELILVDGSSQDNTLAVARQTIEEFPNISSYFISNPKKILASGWNLGIRHAKGKYVIRPDAHAELHPGYIARGFQELEQRHDIVAVGGSLQTKGNGWWGEVIAIALSSRIGVGNSPFRTSTADQYADTAVYALYRREAILNVGGLNEALPRHQDNGLHQNLKRQGWRFFQSSGMQATYYCRSTPMALLAQQFAIGRYLPLLWQHSQHNALSPRHLAPAAFLAYLMLQILLTCCSPWWFFSILPLIAYACLITAESVRLALMQRQPRTLLLLALVPSIHIAYGLGTWFGMISTLGAVIGARFSNASSRGERS